MLRIIVFVAFLCAIVMHFVKGGGIFAFIIHFLINIYGEKFGKKYLKEIFYILDLKD